MTDIAETKKRTPFRLLLWGGLALILLWIGLKAWSITQVTQSLLARQTEVENLLSGGLMTMDPDAAETAVIGIRQDILTLKTEIDPFVPLLPYLSWLPRIGSTLAVAPQLLTMADAGTEAAVYAVRGLKPGLSLLQEDTNSDTIPAMIDLLDAAEPDLIQTSLAIERLATARTNIGSTTELPWRLQMLFTQLDAWLPLAQDGVQVATVLPEIFGKDGSRRYLIIAQNQDEIRATGGFITGAGLLTVDGGRIVGLQFQDANLIDNYADKPYDFPPQPLYDHMQLELFLFRDANYWPDFPTSAEMAMDLYSYGQELSALDGAISIDQRFLQLLVEATGPVVIANTELTITNENVITSLHQAWAIQEGQDNADWILNRKAFLSTFATALQDKLETDFSNVNPILLVQNLYQAVQSKHLQLYMRDPDIAVVLDAIDWDGRLTASTQADALMVVDTNMGFNKVNLLINSDLTYHATLDTNGQVTADLTINYTHTGAASDEPCQQGSLTYEQTPAYLELANRCYLNYLRLFVPETSQLQQSTTHLVPSTALQSGQTWESTATVTHELDGFVTYGNLLLVPYAQTVHSQYQYQIPHVVQALGDQQFQYRLTIYKQAGTRPQPLEILITLPENSQLITVTPTPTQMNGRHINLSLTLEADTVITVVYKEA